MLNAVYRAACAQPVDQSDLDLELGWWSHQLSTRRVCRVQFDLLDLPPILIYSDAEGGGDVGAFWYHCGDLDDSLFSSWQVPSRVKDCLIPRKTQIHAYEAFAAFWALTSCPLVGRRIILLIDNLAVSYNIHKGRSSSFDVNQITHAVHRAADQRSLDLHVWWIPTKSNLSDDPSRGRDAVVGSRIVRNQRNLSILYQSLQSQIKHCSGL
jgi:hypothetical protein